MTKRTAVIVTAAVAAAVVIAAGLAVWLVKSRAAGPRLSSQAKSLSQDCQAAYGDWVSQFDECEGLSRAWCLGQGGQFEECASACRHNPDRNAACTMQCRPVCSFRLASDGSGGGSGSQETPRNATYVVEGRSVKFVDGQASQEADSGQAVGGGYISGESPASDLNGDGRSDLAVLITRDRGQARLSYVAAALQAADGSYRGTEAVLIGEWLQVIGIQNQDGQVLVKYLDRHPWEKFPDKVTVNKTRSLAIVDGRFQALPPAGGQLTVEAAKALAVSQWGDCQPGRCRDLQVSPIEGGDGVWYVEAVFSGLADDSVQAERKIMLVRYFNGAWQRGQVVLQQQRCQPERGSQEFSGQACL